MSSVFSLGSDIATIVSVIVAVVAIVISIRAYYNAKKGQQFGIVDKFLSEIGQLDMEVANLHRMYKETKDIQLLGICLDQTLSKLFNKLDWISFLINKEEINNESLKKYVYPLIKGHYEKTYLQSASKAMRNDTEYENFKTLYEKIKDENSILRQI